MSKYLPEGWTQNKIDDALEFQRKSPNPTNPKQEGTNMKNQAKDSLGNATERPWRLGTRNGERAIYGPKGEEIAVFTGMLFNDEELANARLIASAPELLSSLHDVREWANRVLESDIKSEFLREFLAALNDAEKVIARAEGRA